MGQGLNGSSFRFEKCFFFECAENQKASDFKLNTVNLLIACDFAYKNQQHPPLPFEKE